MENVTDALKIAFAVMMFVLALTLSISSFSQANNAIEAVVTMRDRKTEYTYVKPASDLNKIVGAETVIPTMYKAYKENFSIYFYEKYTDENNNVPLILYNYYDPNGNSSKNKKVNYIDLEQEILPNATEAIKHLNILLGKKSTISSRTDLSNSDKQKYRNQIVHADGLYEFFKDKKFKEVLGEYYQEDKIAGKETDTIETNKTKKRIITYILQD